MSYYNYYLCIVYCAPERQIVMVLPRQFCVFLSSLPSSLLPVLLSSPGRGEKTTVWEEGEGAGGRMVGAAVICKSFIYVWHLHNEAGSQWQPWLAGDRVACLQF